MIFYKSTRGEDKKQYSFSETVLQGIARDGGLLVPEEIPHVYSEQLKTLKQTSYQKKALFILKQFQTDLSEYTLKRIVDTAYANNYDNPSIVPIVHLKENQYLLELWHGPTLAFKDMALQIMPLLFSEAIKKRDETSLRYLILVATSGDTGKAALEGYKDKKDIAIMVFYPYGHVSKLQELQMTTQIGKNIAVYAIDGDFDAVQKIVKDIFNDKRFNQKLLDKYQTVLSSANSINWGRLLPQIIYYASSYIDLVDRKGIQWGDRIDVVVPTGNFGNILAGFYAKKMGVPIRKLICASNANNVLTDFFQTGAYDITHRTLIKTPSPSMDILIAGNIERLLFLVTNNSEKVSRWMMELQEKKKFIVDTKTRAILQNEFYADWVSNEESLLNIKRVFQQTGYLMDPHTSVAQTVAQRYSQKMGVSVSLVICSTAHWSKFAKEIYRALKPRKEEKLVDEFEMLEGIVKLAPSVSIPKVIKELKNKRIIYRKGCKADKEELKDVIVDFAKFLYN